MGMTRTDAIHAALVWFQREALTVVKAAQRVVALALVDAAITVPRASPVVEAALRTLQLEKTSTGADFLLYRPSEKPIALLILCHPSAGKSLCRTVAAIWEEQLKHAGVTVQVVELGASDGRDSALGPHGKAELQAALGRKDGSTPEEVSRLQRLVGESRFLIFVHPIFWFEVPAALKGFLESVLSSGFAYRKLPSCWTLNKAVGLLGRLPLVPSLLRRYSAYGYFRDKSVYITRTQGGPEAGLNIFRHGSTSLESSMLFCGAHVHAIDSITELDDLSPEQLASSHLPKLRHTIAAHCNDIAASAAAIKKVVDGQLLSTGSLCTHSPTVCID